MNILKALSSGFSTLQIMGTLASAYPYLAQRIKDAQKVGHNIEDILKQFQGASKKDLKKFNDMAKNSANPLIAGQSHAREGSGEAIKRKVLPAVGLAGAALLASPLLRPAGQAALNLLGGGQGAAAAAGNPAATGAMPPSGGSVPPNAPQGAHPPGPSPMGNAPVAAPPIPTSPAPNVAQAAAAVAPPTSNSLQVIQQMGLGPKIDNLLQAGNSPETIGPLIEQLLSPGQKKWVGDQIKAGAIKPVRELVNDYIQSNPTAPAQAPAAPQFNAPEEAPEEQKKYAQRLEAESKPETPEQAERHTSNIEFWDKFLKNKSANREKPLASTKDFIREAKVQRDFLNSHYQKNSSSGLHEEAAMDKEAAESLDSYLHHLHEKDALEEHEKHQKKVAKGSLVATKDGEIGEVKDIKQKEALVESNGKVDKVKVSELIHSPLPEKDLADLHDELVKGIEKETGEEVSRMARWVGYDPNKNILQYLTHGGRMYTYEDVPAEDSRNLRGVLHRRSTTGENYIGAYIEGTDSPIGNAMSALIRKLQSERGGKGNEYSVRSEPVYDSMMPAISKSQARFKAKEKAERDRLKEEKKQQKAKK